MAGTLLAASARFPNLNDAQLQSAIHALRFLDHQSVFTTPSAHLLLRNLQGNATDQRSVFYKQMSLGRRRRPANLKDTPLQTVMELRSEFELTQRSALRLFLQLGMHAESLAIKELFDLLDANDDCSLQVDELFTSLDWLGLLEDDSDAAREDLWLWLQAGIA